MLCDARAVTSARRGAVALGVLVVLVLTASVTTASAWASRALGQAGGKTVVTFTWGGGFANQMGALPAFRRYGMQATFYVPSGLVCQPSAGSSCTHLPYLSLSQVHQIAADGDEIGGLSVNHIPLNMLPPPEAKREICDDRVNLTRWGFRVTDFAYPFALENPTLQRLTQQCGYNSGLGTGQLRGAGVCSTCPFAETIPPANPYVLRTPIEVSSVGTSWTPATFENIVTAAQQNGGGWVIFTVHDVCPRTCSLGVTVPELDTVLKWLHGRTSTGVSVRTIGQVIGGPVRPAVPGPPPPRIPPPGVMNPRLTEVSSGVPACFQAARYGTNHAAFSYSSSAGPGGRGDDLAEPAEIRDGSVPPDPRPGRVRPHGVRGRRLHGRRLVQVEPARGVQRLLPDSDRHLAILAHQPAPGWRAELDQGAVDHARVAVGGQRAQLRARTALGRHHGHEQVQP